MFQLSESNDLTRITAILDALTQYSRDALQSLKRKYKLNEKLLKVLKKYCNGDYGFDTKCSKLGRFQFSFIKLLSLACAESITFTEFLQNKVLEYLS